MKNHSLFSALALFSSTVVACSSTEGADSTDGAAGTGGNSNNGGSESIGSGGSTGGSDAGSGGNDATGGSESSGGSDGTGGSVATQPCPAGSIITASTTSAGFANYGNVFGSSYYQKNQPSSANPEKIQVQVTNDGAPVNDCEVGWETADGHGWVFADSATTDAEGKLSAYWTAGDEASQTATAFVTWTDGGTSRVDITGSAQPGPETRGNSVHFTSYPGTYSEYKVQVTPVTGPESTYYETHGFVGAYGGIQFVSGTEGRVIFSTWDVDTTHKAVAVNGGACNEKVGFGGEGTGVSGRLHLPPSQYGAIAGLPNDYLLKPGDTYELHLVIASGCGGSCTEYTYTFTDITRGFGPISLGTQRYAAPANNDYNDIFIEDWTSQSGDTCINAKGRTAYFHDMQARIGGTWQDVVQGNFNPNYVPSNTEVCQNYFAETVSRGKFLLSSGGSDYVGAPLFDDGKTLD